MGKSNLTMYKKKYKHSQVEFIAGMKGWVNIKKTTTISTTQSNISESQRSKMTQ